MYNGRLLYKACVLNHNFFLFSYVVCFRGGGVRCQKSILDRWLVSLPQYTIELNSCCLQGAPGQMGFPGQTGPTGLTGLPGEKGERGEPAYRHATKWPRVIITMSSFNKKNIGRYIVHIFRRSNLF